MDDGALLSFNVEGTTEKVSQIITPMKSIDITNNCFNKQKITFEQCRKFETINNMYVGILCFESEVFNFLFSNFSSK